ncbi:hypothetical protein HUJ04_000508 [Dendroctonus ponderosae]|nr:hypothetical protein HUJ04_000508 [Dendroctonus ponderosae]
MQKSRKPQKLGKEIEKVNIPLIPNSQSAVNEPVEKRNTIKSTQWVPCYIVIKGKNTQLLNKQYFPFRTGIRKNLNDIVLFSSDHEKLTNMSKEHHIITSSWASDELRKELCWFNAPKSSRKMDLMNKNKEKAKQCLFLYDDFVVYHCDTWFQHHSEKERSSEIIYVHFVTQFSAKIRAFKGTDSTLNILTRPSDHSLNSEQNTFGQRSILQIHFYVEPPLQVSNCEVAKLAPPTSYCPAQIHPSSLMLFYFNCQDRAPLLEN